MEKRKVSIIMGIYNVEKTLPQAIESIIRQSYTNWELILCDDGSSDGTYSIAEHFQAHFPDKIILLKNAKNLRLAATLNHCLKHVSGEFIARMDADDESLPKRLEKQVDYLINNPECSCVGTAMIVFNDSGRETVRRYIENPTKKNIVLHVPFAHPTIMIRSSVMLQLKGYVSSSQTMRAEDGELWFRFFALGNKGYNLQEPLYRYRENSTDFNKRTLKAAWGASKVLYNGFQLIHAPWYSYVRLLKPIASALIPGIFSQYIHYLEDLITK